MKKNLVILLLAGSLGTLLVAGGSMAWFTAADEMDNTLVAGTVEIAIDEHGFDQGTPLSLQQPIEKIVSVKSIGTKRTYVRVSLTPIWSNPTSGTIGTIDLPESNVELTLSSSANWKYYKGWYYYLQFLSEGDETENLITDVRLKAAETGPEYSGQTLQVFVNAEAVQASHQAFTHVWGLSEVEFTALGIAIPTP